MYRLRYFDSLAEFMMQKSLRLFYFLMQYLPWQLSSITAYDLVASMICNVIYMYRPLLQS